MAVNETNTPGTAPEKKRKRRKDTLRYYDQSDWMRPVGLGLIVAGLLLIYFGWSFVSYILACLAVPGGLFLFFFDAMRHISDADVEKERDHMFIGFDRSVTEMDNYDRTVLRQPPDLLTEGWIAEGKYFRQVKGGGVISDRFARSHLFFTREALLICSREVSITEMDSDTNTGYTDRNERLSFAEIRAARLEEASVPVKLTKGGKSAVMRTHTLVLEGSDGELLRLPVRNDMDSSALCDAVNRRVKEESRKQ